MDRKNPINSYIIEFETAVQRKLMRLNIVALQDQMDAVRYCTQWLLNHLDKMDAYSPVQLASATTKHRVIEFIRQQKQQAAERARGADGEYVSNARLENLSRADQQGVDEATVTPSAEDQYFSNPDPETLEAIAKALTPKQNEVFVGRVFSGKTVTEVAHDLKAKPNHITKCYKSAQQRLQLAVINNPEGFGIEAWQIDKHIRAM